MFTYLILNIIFLGLAFIILRAFGAFKNIRIILLTIAILIIFTAIFDSLIVGLGIVAYDSDKLLGIFIGTAPIEDFFYALLAGVIVPVVWQIGGHIHERKN